jgi:hypothetical protein
VIETQLDIVGSNKFHQKTGFNLISQMFTPFRQFENQCGHAKLFCGDVGRKLLQLLKLFKV